jgi:hypothetical protein
LPESLATTVKTTIADWQSRATMQRLWQRDATLWTGSDEGKWLGWLDVVDEQISQHDELQKIAQEVQVRGFNTYYSSAWGVQVCVRKCCA